jgi:pimeloyl-ACP methyl ester carboxylesterase
MKFEPIDTRRAINGVEIVVTEWGGDGDTIFFGHPTGFFGKIWKPVIDRLRIGGFEGRIITFDQRGQGMSSKHDNDYSWDEMGNDTAELVDELDLRDAVGVGHSAGATFVALAAARRPGRFRRLVLIDPILLGSMSVSSRRSGGNSSMAKRTRTRRLVYDTRRQMFDAYRNRGPYATWTDEALNVYVDLGTFERPDGTVELLCPGRIEAQLYEGANGVDPVAEFDRLDIPVLLAIPDGTDVFRAALRKKTLDALPNGRFLEFANATHFVPMEQPDVVAGVLLAECKA